jgi:hypothetical protein
LDKRLSYKEAGAMKGKSVFGTKNASEPTHQKTAKTLGVGTAT